MLLLTLPASKNINKILLETSTGWVIYAIEAFAIPIALIAKLVHHSVGGV